MKQVSGIIAGVVLLAGCASSSGNGDIAKLPVIQQIEAGRSTLADVEALLGSPTRINLGAGGRQLVYVYTNSDSTAGSALGIASAVLPLPLAFAADASTGASVRQVTFTVLGDATDRVADCGMATSGQDTGIVNGGPLTTALPDTRGVILNCSREHLRQQQAAAIPAPPPTVALTIVAKTAADRAIAPIAASRSAGTIRLDWPATPCNGPRPTITRLTAPNDTTGVPVALQTAGACNEITTVTAQPPLLLRSARRSVTIEER